MVLVYIHKSIQASAQVVWSRWKCIKKYTLRMRIPKDLPRRQFLTKNETQFFAMAIEAEMACQSVLPSGEAQSLETKGEEKMFSPRNLKILRNDFSRLAELSGLS